jgi:UDP-N-acetylglucosamine transferase subunit ALG13
MIFVTVGTEKFPFERLVKTIDEAKQRGIIQEDVFMQIGNSGYQPVACQFEKFLPFYKMINFIQSADIVVSHAGIGSTLLCLHSGKTPIIFPRNVEYKEHLDNHQLDFAVHIQKLSVALVCFECDDLIKKLSHYKEYVETLSLNIDENQRHRIVDYLRTCAEMPEVFSYHRDAVFLMKSSLRLILLKVKKMFFF